MANAMANAICKSAYENDELSKPAKKDIFDKLADSIMSLLGEEPHEKTQREQLYGAQFLEISLQQQETASEFSQAFETSCRASVSFDRVSEVLSSEAGEANIRTNPTKGDSKANNLPALYDPNFAAQQMLNGGRVSESTLRTIIPKGIPNTFKPSTTIAEGYKYNFDINGTKMEIKWHSADANAAAKFTDFI